MSDTQAPAETKTPETPAPAPTPEPEPDNSYTIYCLTFAATRSGEKLSAPLKGKNAPTEREAAAIALAAYDAGRPHISPKAQFLDALGKLLK
jgi:hypothetical protein